MKKDSASKDIACLRAEVAAAIQTVVTAEGLSTLAAAARTGIHRTEFSRLMNGHFGKFSLERLLHMASSLGVRYSLRLKLPKRMAALRREADDKSLTRSESNS
jgi:predicted XRE-type DNA-binding protein